MGSSATVAPPYVAGPFRLDPFQGIMLAPHRVGDPASARAFARPYRAVVERMTRWEHDGYLVHHKEPAVYVHEYTSGGITVRGLVGALDLSHRAAHTEDRVVLPHEGVHPAQAAELGERMAKMGLNPAPILLVHRGPAPVRALVRRFVAGAPDHEFTDRADQRHRVWAIRDVGGQAELAEALAGSRALLADGHHRYAAYLRMQESRPGTAADRGLTMLVDQDDTPLFLGAIHRVLVGTPFTAIEKAAAGHGAFTVCSSGAAVAALGPATLVVTDGRTWATWSLDLPDGSAAVEIFHEVLLPALPTPPARLGYHHSVDDALGHLRGTDSVAVLMPAIGFDTVRKIVADDRLLPEKATSFQPKPSLGVLMRSLRDG